MAWFAILCVGFLLFFYRAPLHRFLFETIGAITLPAFKAGEAVAFLMGNSFLTSRQTLIEENFNLKKALREAEFKISQNKLLESENNELQAQLGRSPKKESFAVASIIAKPNRSPYDTLLLDIGTDEGIRPGMLVLAGSSTPIGVITEAALGTSLARLFSSSGQQEEVNIGEKKIAAEAIGVGGGNFRIFLPKDTEIKEGDTVFLSGLRFNEPGDILGTVERIEKNEVDTVARIFFKSQVNIYELSLVFIKLE